MANAETNWSLIHDAFDPGEVLVGTRSRDLYCEREHSPSEVMRIDFSASLHPIRPPIAFFTGHRGSGKSSMLWRLVEQLKDDYFVVYFDIEHNLDSNKTNQVDLLFLLGATVFQVAAQEGLKPDSENLKLLARSVYTLTETEKQKVKDESLDVVKLAKNLICFGASAFGGGLGEKLAKAALEPFNFSSGVSEEVVRKREIEPQVQKIITNVNLIIADVQTQADRNVLVVVDGLDKLQRSSQAELIFLESRALRGPKCRIIYTVPMLIFTSPPFGEAEDECKSYFLPNIKVYEKKTEKKYPPGYQTLTQVVAKRLDGVGIEPEGLFEPGALDLLIKNSGGLMRWFIELVQEACTHAQIRGDDRVTKAAARQAIEDRAAKLALRLNVERIEELKQIRNSNWPSGAEGSRELLQSRLAVAYRNSETWFDAHPLVWERLKE